MSASYENSTAAVVAKLLLRKHALPSPIEAPEPDEDAPEFIEDLEEHQ